MTEQAEAVTFLEALDRLAGRLTSDQAPDNRYMVQIIDLVHAEGERVRGVAEPDWPDTLWWDYRISLILVERQLMAIFDPYPERPEPAVWDRALQVTRWLVQLSGDVRKAIGREPLH